MTRVIELIDQLTMWAQEKGWQAERAEKIIHEKPLGTYKVPTLTLAINPRRLEINPIGQQVIGADGRVDIEAFPALSRIKLLADRDGWRIVTDSNVPLRIAWTVDSFAQLANDLLA